MVRGKRERPGQRGGDAAGRRSARGSDDEQWDPKDPEEDPLRDLRPHEDDMQSPASDDYIWPETDDENEDDD